MGTVAFRRGFRCRSQLRGQWRSYTALPAHLWRIVVYQRPKLLESTKPTAILSGQTIRISTGQFNYEAEKTEWVAAVSSTSKNVKRPRSPIKKIEGVTKILLFA
jgi:hypothetical protein